MQSVEKPAAEEPSGHRFLQWVVRHPGYPCGRGLQPVEETGDTIGHSLSTRHGYCYGFEYLRFLRLQQLPLRGTIFGTWGLTNRI